MKFQEQQEQGGLVAQLTEGKTIDFQQVMMRKAHLEQLKVKLLNKKKFEKKLRKPKKRSVRHWQAMKDKKILEEDKEKKRDMWRDVMKRRDEVFR